MLTVTNYSSKKSLSKAIASGKVVKPLSPPLTTAQLRANHEAEKNGVEHPFVKEPIPTSSEASIMLGSTNKQAKIEFISVFINSNGVISKIL